VPMKMTLSGLLSVPEVCLAKACLRRLNDAADTLATAEIVAMADCSEPETWLADRLRWLERDGDGFAWAEDSHPIVAKLKTLREATGTQSPVEIVARVLNYIGIREVATAWGPNAIKAAQRQRNLDALLNLAVEYERHCDSQHLAATLTGLLFWLEHPHSAELDLQPVVTTGDAVHVLTYHKAKGLEWPVVVAADFHYSWAPRLWDVRIESDGGAFDVERPLANRVVRFWPGVFGSRTKDLPVLDAIRASSEGASCLERGEAENRRLAYVGLTRARDTIVLAMPSRNAPADAWLHSFGGDYLLPDGESLALADGDPIATLAVRLEADAAAVEPLPFAPRRLPERAPRDAPARERISPSAATAIDDAELAEAATLGERIPLYGSDVTAIGVGLHAAIAAELTNPARSDALERTRALLAAAGVETFVDAAAALTAAQRLRDWIGRRFAPTRVLTEYPIVHRLGDGRVVRGWIDVLLETADGWVVIDHKSSPRPRSEWVDEVRAHAGQLGVYADALRACGGEVASCWLHFPVGGGAVRVDLPVTARARTPF
jgi:ATP-dependent helicase/nuclease subunit A